MELEKLKTAVENRAKTLGITEYEVFCKSNLETTVETLNKEISSFSSSLTGGACVRVIRDGKMGYASGELITEESVAELVSIAAETAQFIDRTDEVGIFSGSPSYSNNKKPEYIPKTASELKEIALSVAEAAYSASEFVENGTCTAAGATGYSISMFNSKGLSLSTEGGFNYCYCESIVNSRGTSECGFSIKEVKDGFSADAPAKKSVDEAISKIGAVKVKTGNYKVIIDGKRMSQLLSAFSPAFSAKNAQMGTSLLKDKEGETVASIAVTITDDPMREELSVGTFFDAEGVSAKRKCVIERGVLRTLLHNRETAKRAGVETTGNASKQGFASPIGISPYAFCIEAGDKSLDELLLMAGDGILVTELNGLHAGTNAVTGDFSLESAGYLIKNGKRGKAVKSFTISGNFFELLKNITALSDEIEFGLPGVFTSYASAAALVENMSVAGE